VYIKTLLVATKSTTNKWTGLCFPFSGHQHDQEKGETCIHRKRFCKKDNIQEKEKGNAEEDWGTEHPLWNWCMRYSLWSRWSWTRGLAIALWGPKGGGKVQEHACSGENQEDGELRELHRAKNPKG